MDTPIPIRENGKVILQLFQWSEIEPINICALTPPKRVRDKIFFPCIMFDSMKLNVGNSVICMLTNSPAAKAMVPSVAIDVIERKISLKEVRDESVLGA